MRLQFLVPDGLPSFRPDLTVLFGKYLPRSGVLSDLVTYHSDAQAPAVWGGGKARVSPAPRGRFRSMPSRIANYLGALAGARAKGLDAIQIRDMPLLAAVGLAAARLSGLPFFYWMSFPVTEMEARMASERGLRWGLAKYLMLALRSRIGHVLLHKIVLPNADHVFVHSEGMKAKLAAGGVATERMTAVPMCVDPDAFPEADRWQPHNSKTFTFAYLGTCEKARRVDFLFEALARLRTDGRDARLLLVGDAWLPSEQGWLRQTAADLGVADAVTITGWVPADAARRHLLAADVAVSLVPPDPVFDVASPTKLVEYMALGMPVLANAHPDQSEVLTASGAGVIAPFEVEPFAAALARMDDDRAATNAMGRRGPIYVDRHRSYAVMAPRVASVYRAVLGHQPITEALVQE